MPQTLSHRIAYTGILVVFLFLATLFAWRVPDWQAPDEPAHYNYIAQVASGEFLPVIETGDWDNDYLEALKANDFAPDLLDNLDAVQYENHQPPLYYWIATPVFILSNGNLFAVRMVSVLLAMITVALSYTITLSIFPEHPHYGLAVMALVAFLPQNMHMLASINNDALAGMVLAATVLLCVHYLKNNNVPVWSIGLAIGITFITKTTIYFMAGVALIVILMKWWQSEERDFASLVKNYVGFGIPAAAFALLYWGRNIMVYGFPDFLGLQAHDEVVVGQLRRSEFIANNGADEYWRRAIFDTFNSFWGQFGWMEARLTDALPFMFPVLIALLILAISGLILHSVYLSRKEGNAGESRTQIWIMLGLIILLAFLQYIYYNLTFVQFQGRYLFVAIIPFAILMTIGVDAWRKLLLSWNELSVWLTVGIFVLFAALDFYLIWRVIPCAVGC